ncbi:UDP-N-acetylmuramate dehydrogenase [Hyphococcus flavus]|uniref:UDP-N-acetylenolpyruvoylglucosamine reductase n=1 Tax=Hyphococcus flavus TaxID=1866326 RepID=A0AAE9ZCF9_9PROT|nr:UDP-N-acetylmuramate dehydrogenase [Hyphococcus flavus]WDI30397.1 UDP-N-acetylmuramate dehydrogenase [Hyphococcus flavus]
MKKITVQYLPTVRGKYIENADLSALTWFRVGGLADVLFMPADEQDVSHFLKETPEEIPVYVMGVGSNLLVRDGGVRGVVIRFGSPFRQVHVEGMRVTAGAGCIDAQVAKRAAQEGVAGLEFFRGVPGTIGGAIKMNAGAYGGEVKDVLVEAVAYDRKGERRVLSNADLGFSYRHSSAPDDLIFISATFEGTPDEPDAIIARMDKISAEREASQPIRERTGGSTFANPDVEKSGGRKAWQLIDEIGGRGRIVGDAQVSERHCNFMINRGDATAADLEELIESLRKDVLTKTGVELRWEIKRVGEASR